MLHSTAGPGHYGGGAGRACTESDFSARLLLYGSIWQDGGHEAAAAHPYSCRCALGSAPADSRIELTGSSDRKKIGTLIVVALIFGIVNAVLKPIIKTIGCLFYVLTLGLIGLVVNGLLLWLCSWVAGKLSLPFHITGFWPGVLGRHHCRDHWLAAQPRASTSGSADVPTQ